MSAGHPLSEPLSAHTFQPTFALLQSIKSYTCQPCLWSCTRNALQVALKWLLIWHLQAFRRKHSAELNANKERVKNNGNNSVNANIGVYACADIILA